MRKLVALLAVLSMVSAASAGITFSYTSTDLGYGLVGYDLFLTGDSAVNAPTAVDVTITGTFVQGWTKVEQTDPFGGGTGVYDYYPTPNGEGTGFDTQFVGVVGENPGNLLVESMSEDNPLAGFTTPTGVNLPGVNGWGLGTTLQGAYGIKGQTAMEYQFAHIVLFEGEMFDIVGEVANGDGEKFAVAVPEPATLGLLAMGVIGLLRKRA